MRVQLTDLPARLSDRYVLLRSSVAAARYQHRRLFTAVCVAMGLALLVAAGAVDLVRGSSAHSYAVTTHAPDASATSARPLPLPSAPHAPTALGRASSCRAAVSNLLATSREHPVYATLPAALNRQAQADLDAVGQLCDERIAKRTMNTLNRWLTAK